MRLENDIAIINPATYRKIEFIFMFSENLKESIIIANPITAKHEET
jgi:hypothetical protein